MWDNSSGRPKYGEVSVTWSLKPRARETSQSGSASKLVQSSTGCRHGSLCYLTLPSSVDW